ncbi:sensor histidine kinase [Pedobacter boryungensis]|uniref:histidine kinase n=1 Tax=Pedobacter boryungensis TaxID=869962 RepID=A0ABX2DBG6_9SPHI|nr:HAMP domain-containing sensor histidine kinase [Pedobacter boryungensis]NQX31290.1 HAMP domain-containing histidine kinase [Pedobacter boryungensis]
MKLSSRYNQVNIFTSLIALIITGVIYYVVIHFILTDKLDKDLAVEENEINQYVKTYQKLPLPASYIDQQVHYKEVKEINQAREFSYTTYYNAKEQEIEPGRSLITTIALNDKKYVVTITKSRVESEDLVRIILFITLGITCFLLISLILINRFVLNSLWKPFYTLLNQMKAYQVSRMGKINRVPTKIDEFNELNDSAIAMAASVQQDYKELKSFTDNASHEMMTPLAVINSKLDSLLQTEPFTKSQGALLEDIYQAVGRLSRLNQSLLLLAKIENNLIPDLQDIDMKELLESKIRQFQELFEKDGLQLIHQLESCQLRMSKYLVDILMNNLFSNAVRHNHKGGLIEVRLQKDSLQLINTGRDAGLEGQLFDRFSKSAPSEGLGLGLAISKQICALYGFTIAYTYQNEKHFFTVHF